MSNLDFGNTLTSAKRGIKRIQPTLVLGLGGTGKEALLRLRQRFFEKYGHVGFPALRYLWLDTDLRNQNVDGKPLDYIKEGVQFEEYEKINLEIPEADYDALFRNPNSKQHIFRWLEPSLQSLGSVLDGARQIRSLGRLSFFHHAFANNDIRDHLGKAIEHVLSREVRDIMLTEHSIQVEDRLQVILASSLAGGTGSGLFLDLAFLLRDEFRSANPDIIGYLMLPSVFAPEAHHVDALYANAYAALMELEFYSLRKDLLHTGWNNGAASSAHDFEVEWRPGEARKIAGPPFNVCYFIDNQTKEGGIIGPERKTDLCDMIAENIFMEFSSEGIAALKRSMRSNLDDHLINPLEYDYTDSKRRLIHKDIFSCRFSAFGLSKIYVPVDYLVNRCTYKLSSDLLAFLLAENELEVMTEEATSKFLLSPLNLGIENIKGELQVEHFQKRSLEQRIRDDWQTRRSDLRRLFNGKMKKQEKDGFVKLVDARFAAYEKNFVSSGNEKGDFNVLLRVNRERFLKDSQNRIHKQVEEWLNDPGYRAQAAKTLLLKLNQILAKHYALFANEVKEAQKRIRRARETMQDYLDILQDEEPRRFVYRQSIPILLKFICDAAADHFVHRIVFHLNQEASQFCEQLQKFVAEKIANIEAAQALLKQLKDEVDRNLQSYQHLETHIIFENLFTPANSFGNYYKLKDGIGIGPTQLRNLQNSWLQWLRSQPFCVDGLLSLPSKREASGFPVLLDEFIVFCREKFEYLAGAKWSDAIHMLNRLNRECPERVTESIKRLAQNGQVWIRPSALSATDLRVAENYHEAVLWGVCQQRNDEEYRRFKDKLKRYIQASSSRRRLYPPVDVAPDSVYFYNEYAGIPLMFIARLKEYRKAYFDYYERHRRTPHIDRDDEKYTDILIQTAEEIQASVEAHRLLFLGVILRVIDTKEEDGKFTFVYQDKSAFPPMPIQLGPQQMVLESLLKHKNTKARIEAEIKSRRDRLSQNHSTWLQYFTTLSCHINGDDFVAQNVPPGPFPPTWGKSGRTYSPRYPVEHCALSHARDEEKEALKKALGINESVLSRLFVEFFEHLDEFTEPVKFQDKTLRVMREEVLRAAEPKDEERRCA